MVVRCFHCNKKIIKDCRKVVFNSSNYYCCDSGCEKYVRVFIISEYLNKIDIKLHNIREYYAKKEKGRYRKGNRKNSNKKICKSNVKISKISKDFYISSSYIQDINDIE